MQCLLVISIIVSISIIIISIMIVIMIIVIIIIRLIAINTIISMIIMIIVIVISGVQYFAPTGGCHRALRPQPGRRCRQTNKKKLNIENKLKK